MSQSQDIANVRIRADASELDAAAAKIKKTGETLGTFEKQAATAATSVGKSFKDVASSFNPVALGVGALTTAIATFSLNALKNLASSTVEARSELYKLSVQTGISASTLSGLKGIAALAGTSMDEVAQLTTKFNQAVSQSDKPTSVQAEAFLNLGITLKDSNGHFKDTLTLQQEAARKLNEHADGIEKDAYYMALWGKTATQNKLYLKELGDQQTIHGRITDEQAKKAYELEKAWTKLSTQGANEFKKAVAELMLPALDSLISKLSEATKASGGFWAAFSPNHFVNTLTPTSALQQRIANLDEEIARKSAKSNPNERYIADLKEQRANAQAMLDAARVAEYATRNQSAATDPRRTDAPKPLPNLHEAPPGTERTVNGWSAYSSWHEAGMAEAAWPAKLEAERNKLLDATNRLVEQQRDKLAAARGEDVERLRIERDFKRELDAAKAIGDDELVQSVEERKEAALYLLAQENITKATKHHQEVQAQVVDAQRELNALTTTWSKTIDATTYGDLKIYTQSPQERALAQYKAQQEQIRAEFMKDEQMWRLRSQEAALRGDRLGQSAYDEHADEIVVRMNEALRQSEWIFRNVAAVSDDAWAGMKGGLKAFADQIPTLNNAMASFTQNTLNDFSDRLVSLFTTGKFGFEDFARTAVTALMKIQVQMAALRVMGYFGYGSMAAGGSSAALAMASGGAFDRGVRFFASGDVVNRPTAFGYSGGIGVAGEAGPEAIMPLRRGSDGKLGVVAAGSGDGVQIGAINVSVQAAKDEDASVTGQRVAEAIMVRIADSRIANATRSGGILSRR